MQYSGHRMKKNGLRALAVFAMLFLFATAFLPKEVSAAHLNKYKKTLFVGESFQLKLLGADGKVTYSSSRDKVATVSKKGLIHGKKRGKAVITAKCGKKTYKCTVQVNTMQDSYMSSTRTQINKMRRNYGLTALDYDKYLQSAAKKRAKELATKYSHQRPNGTQFTSAISLKYNYGSYCYEIIARAYTSPASVVKAWMNNADTKKAIIGKAYEDIGAGYYVADDGTEYWCVIVAAKK